MTPEEQGEHDTRHTTQLETLSVAEKYHQVLRQRKEALNTKLRKERRRSIDAEANTQFKDGVSKNGTMRPEDFAAAKRALEQQKQ
jgi:hypothetical protein